jgi:hypothetical protein
MSTWGTPTDEEIQKVRRYECTINGHDYNVISSLGSDGPTRIVCSNCGRTWGVKGSDDE